MVSNVHMRIYSLAAISAVMALAAVVLPRFLPSGEGGLAAAATGVLVFLALLSCAVAVALAALALSIRAYSSLSWPARAAGIGPAVVLGAALIGVVVYLRY